MCTAKGLFCVAVSLQALATVGLLASSPAAAHSMKGFADRPDLLDQSEFDTLVMNQPDDDTRWVVSRTLLWKPGATVTACFLDGSEGSRAEVIKDAKDLVSTPGHPVNLKISFANGTATTCTNGGGGLREDIRVTFNQGCCSAYVGRVSHVSSVANGASVFLQEGLDDMRIKHELLHALGFQHEHQRPGSPCHFNYDVIAQSYGWTQKEVDNNFKQMNQNSSRLAMSPQFDPKSIMKYYFQADFLKEGTHSPCYIPEATDLSDGDWEGLQAAYPMNFNNAKFKQALSKRDAITLGPDAPADFGTLLNTMTAD